MPEAWRNGPCTDPFGRVFVRDGRIYRALFREATHQALAVLDHPAVQELMGEGRVVRMWRSNVVVDGYGAVLEAEKAAFDVPCGRFSFGALRRAALDWLEITRRLRPAGLALTDAHYGNFMLFGANRPRWIDLGSIRSAAVLPEEAPFKAWRMFRDGMLAPLRLLASHPGHARLARLSIADQPAQGPCVARGEAPLRVADLVEEDIPGLEALAADEAFERARDLVPEEKPAGGAAHVALDEKLLRHVARALDKVEALACVGAETCQALGAALAGKDVLVVDHDPDNLARLERSAQERLAVRSLSLWQEHWMNRFFRQQGARADAVVALDPERALAHPSLAEAANIAEALDSCAERMAVVVAPYERRASTRKMLEQRFGRIEAQHFGWPMGGWDVLVCAQA